MLRVWTVMMGVAVAATAAGCASKTNDAEAE